jgi:protein phosphatase-4 regulatory subunit 3
MDENSLSTLSSLMTFTHADVVKGVTQGGDDSYLVKVLRMLATEISVITQMEWNQLQEQQSSELLPTAAKENITTTTGSVHHQAPPSPAPSSISELSFRAESKKDETTTSTSWKQHLAPQDGALASRLLRRTGAISFFRELFNMVRVSLQPTDKDDFYAAIVNMEIDILDDNRGGSVNLLSLLASVLSDPSASVEEKGGILEIIAGIAMHDSSHIRRQCLELHEVWKRDESERMACPGRPNPNDAKQIIFCCSPNDLLASLLYLMAVETDAGILLQTSEIMRIILDTDMLGEHGPIEGGPPQGMQHLQMEHPSSPAYSGSIGSDQNNFLAMFYEHYVQWLAAPFQYTILHPVRRAPDEALTSTSDSRLMLRILERFNSGVTTKDPLLRVVSPCAIRSSFAVELLSFCVRAHLHRMKFFLLRSRVLGSVLRLLKPSKGAGAASSGNRCLKLAALRFLRSILSVKDEFYHRHIIQHNLFTPVFEAFRANPVGDNLVSSAIVEMCDFIHNQNIKSLIEYIVTKHLSATSSPSSVTDRPSLEDVATPYVQTLTILRKTYEDDLRIDKDQTVDQEGREQSNGTGSYYDHARSGMSEKAMEDQRKFREVDEEESYFDCDDDEDGMQGVGDSRTMNETTDVENDLHRAPRMFSLTEQTSSTDSREEEIGHGDERQQTTEAENGTGTVDAPI